MHKHLQKNNKNTSTSATIQQKSTFAEGFSLTDNRASSTATQLMTKAHGKSCGCASCSGSNGAVQRKVSKASPSVHDATVIQRACSHCGWEGKHKPGCTPETRAAATATRKETAKKQHDKSMDDRTREDQSHKQHGGDAKGRTKMYAKWNGK